MAVIGGGVLAMRASYTGPVVAVFLLQVLLIGFGGDAVAEVADGELGVAEEGGVIGGDEGAGDVEDVVVAGLGQLVGLCLLSVRESPSGSFLG